MPEPLDGNMLAGPLSDVFTVDISTAVGQCASCGTSAPMGATRVYADAPGLVARCPSCARWCCGWSAGPAGPGWTCAGSAAWSSRCRPSDGGSAMSNLPDQLTPESRPP